MKLSKLARAKGAKTKSKNSSLHLAPPKGGWNEEQLKRELLINPLSARAYYGLGEICNERHQLNEAGQYYRQAININPKMAEASVKLGIILLAIGASQEEALACFQAALQLQPQRPELHKLIGNALESLGRRQEAMAAFQHGLNLQPDSAELIVSKADLLEREGEVEAARELIAPVLENGLHLSAGLVFANLCRHFQECDQAINYLEKLLQLLGHSGNAAEQLHFSLGKLYDRQKKYNKAFEHFERGNKLRPTFFEPEKQVANFAALKKLFSGEFLASAPKSDMDTEVPLFIAGMPRSGTTLVEQILASHPLVYGAGEISDMGRLVGELAQGHYGAKGYPDCFRTLDRQALNILARKYLESVQKLAPEAQRITDKMLTNFQHLGLIALLFPKARVIHCKRDPRDTCLSIYFHSFPWNNLYAHNLEHLGIYYRQYAELMEHWHNVLDIPILDIQYEELVGDQEGWTRRLVEFAGLPWDDHCLAFHKSKRPVTTMSYDQVRRPIYTSSVARWRHYQDHLGPLNRALGMDDDEGGQTVIASQD